MNVGPKRKIRTFDNNSRMKNKCAHSHQLNSSKKKTTKFLNATIEISCARVCKQEKHELLRETVSQPVNLSVNITTTTTNTSCVRARTPIQWPFHFIYFFLSTFFFLVFIFGNSRIRTIVERSASSCISQPLTVGTNIPIVKSKHLFHFCSVRGEFVLFCCS